MRLSKKLTYKVYLISGRKSRASEGSGRRVQTSFSLAVPPPRERSCASLYAPEITPQEPSVIISAILFVSFVPLCLLFFSLLVPSVFLSERW
jgi:hypothetical protein